MANLWIAVLLIGLAAAHQGWSANLFTLAPDMFPRRAVGSVTGFGGMLFSVGVGFLLQKTNGNYVPLFWIAGLAYLFAFLVIQTLSPRLEPAVFREAVATSTPEQEPTPFREGR